MKHTTANIKTNGKAHGKHVNITNVSNSNAFSALTLLVWWQEEHPACKN